MVGTYHQNTMKILTQIWNWITKASKSITTALTIGNVYVNELKKITDSPIVAAIVMATPTTVDDAVLKYIKTGLQKYVTIKGIADKTLGELKQDADVYASTLIELSAYTAKKYAEYKKESLTIQQAMASTPVVYDKSIIE